MRMLRYGLIAGIAVLVAAAFQPARAQTFTASSNQGDGTTKASAVFSVTGADTCGTGHQCLEVVLTNTTQASSFTYYHNPSILDGLFFDINGGTSTTLSAWSAITPNALFNPGGCSQSSCSTGPVNVGQQWGYNYSAGGYSGTSLTTTARYGFSAAGFSGLTGWSQGSGNFNGSGTPPTLGGHLGGMDFGIVASNYTGGSGTAGSAPLANATVTFDFQLPTGVSSVSIRNVTFAYGTAPDGSARAPEPASLALFGTGLAALAFVRQRNAARRAKPATHPC